MLQKEISAELAKEGLLNESERSRVILKEWTKYGFHSEITQSIMCFPSWLICSVGWPRMNIICHILSFLLL